MALIVADTSALVSLGTVADREASPIDLILDRHEVVLPEQVVDELDDTAAYDDPSGDAAAAVLERRARFGIRSVTIDDSPLDAGESAAIAIANDLDATQLLCDEFNRLALVHASLADTRLVTTPTLLLALVRNGDLPPDDAETLLATMGDARSWGANTYVARVRTTLRGMAGDSG